MSNPLDFIPEAILADLSDKLSDRRSIGAHKLITIVEKLAADEEREKIISLIEFLDNEYAKSKNADRRKGGIYGLTSVAIGLSTELYGHLEFFALQKEAVLSKF